MMGVFPIPIKRKGAQDFFDKMYRFGADVFGFSDRTPVFRWNRLCHLFLSGCRFEYEDLEGNL